jgi:hypothetical protein
MILLLNIEIVCIKLVVKSLFYTMMHGRKSIKLSTLMCQEKFRHTAQCVGSPLLKSFRQSNHYVTVGVYDVRNATCPYEVLALREMGRCVCKM